MANPPRESPDRVQNQMNEDYHKFLHTASLVGLVAAPVLIALPPRKLDLYTFALAGAFVVSASYQTRGRAQMSGLEGPGGAPRPVAQPSLAREVPPPRVEAPAPAHKVSTLEQKAKELWMGGETEGWKERRLKEEQEKITRGEGYGSMITDQIWEVWNWGDKKAEALKEKDQQAVDGRKKP